MSDSLNVSVDELQAIYDQIDTLDNKIAAATGSESMGKRAYLNSLANEHQEAFSDFVGQVLAQIKNLESEPTQLAAVVTLLDKAISDSFGKVVEELATTYVNENKQDTPEVSDTEVADWTKDRKILSERYKALRGVLEMFGFDVSVVPEPKKMTGSRGPRGPRTLSSFNYFVDGKERSKTQNSLGSIANTILKDTPYGNAKDLRNFLVEQGLDVNNPPDEWAFDVPVGDGKTINIKAVKTEEKDEFSSSDDNDEEPEND